MRLGLTYNDTLLKPQYSDIRSRNEVDIGNSLGDRYFSTPIISAPMDTVTEGKMSEAMYNAGGLGIIHRYNSVSEQVRIAKSFLKKKRTAQGAFVGAAVGITGDYHERAHELIKVGVQVICLDIAHAHHVLTKEALFSLKRDFHNVHFMVGNVATAHAFSDLCEWGADSIKVGIGGGSICSTRIKTGHGVPGLQAVVDCAKAKTDNRTLLIADGGIKSSGDIVKALAAGADFVMLGSLLAGTDESPGETYDSEKGKVKIYQGMASSEAQMRWKGSVSSREGISTTIAYKGSVKDIVEDLSIGIRSGFSYTGARNISELWEKSQFMRQTTSGITESATHILFNK